MQFALVLLLLLVLACAGGSFITQGQTYEWYAAQYSERAAGAIIALGLDHVYQCWWFVAITAFLCLNLIACNLVRLPSLLKRYRQAGEAERYVHTAGAVSAEEPLEEEQARKVFSDLGFRQITQGEGFLFAARNRAGFWGAWVCHLGILILIIGFGFGQMAKETYMVYGLPGQSKAIGDTSYILTIDDFSIGLREDDTVEQYTSRLTVHNASDGTSQSAEASVNAPADMYGMRFYQNSTGWAARVNIMENGEPLQSEVICVGEYVSVEDKPDLVVYLNAFYPDYYLDPGQGPMSLSSKINNPAYLYSVFYMGQMLGMNALLETEELTIDEYTVTFSEPQNFTIIQIKKDPFTFLALIGGLVTLLGLVLAFYIQYSAVWAVEENGKWTMHGTSPKGGVLFRDRFLRAVTGKEQEN